MFWWIKNYHLVTARVSRKLWERHAHFLDTFFPSSFIFYFSSRFYFQFTHAAAVLSTKAMRAAFTSLSYHSSSENLRNSSRKKNTHDSHDTLEYQSDLITPNLFGGGIFVLCGAINVEHTTNERSKWKASQFQTEPNPRLWDWDISPFGVDSILRYKFTEHNSQRRVYKMCDEKNVLRIFSVLLSVCCRQLRTDPDEGSHFLRRSFSHTLHSWSVVCSRRASESAERERVSESDDYVCSNQVIRETQQNLWLCDKSCKWRYFKIQTFHTRHRSFWLTLVCYVVTGPWVVGWKRRTHVGQFWANFLLLLPCDFSLALHSLLYVQVADSDQTAERRRKSFHRLRNDDDDERKRRERWRRREKIPWHTFSPSRLFFNSLERSTKRKQKFRLRKWSKRSSFSSHRRTYECFWCVF